MDKLDQNILQLLEADARQSNANIARKLKTNKAKVNYRIERLQKEKIITGFKYITNQVILDKLSFGLLVQFKGILPDKEEEIINKLNRMEGIAWVSAINGKWDMIAAIIEKDIHAFRIILQKIFSVCGEQIKEYCFYVDYEGSISGHKYLYDSPKDISVKYASGENIELTKTESEVYNLLKKDPRMSLLQIASKLNKTYDTIKAKYNYLKSKKVLLRCSPDINIKALGYKEFICLFNLEPSQEKLNPLLDLCVKHPNIIRYAKCLGNFSLILNIQCKDNKELKTILSQIRNRHGYIINSYEIIQSLDNETENL